MLRSSKNTSLVFTIILERVNELFFSRIQEPATSNGVSTKRGEGKPGWQESGHCRPPSQMELEIGSTFEIQLPTNSEKELPPSEMDNIAEFDTTPM